MFFSIPWTGNAYVLTRSEKVLITKYTTAYELFKLILPKHHGFETEYLLNF